MERSCTHPKGIYQCKYEQVQSRALGTSFYALDDGIDVFSSSCLNVKLGKSGYNVRDLSIFKWGEIRVVEEPEIS